MNELKEIIKEWNEHNDSEISDAEFNKVIGSPSYGGKLKIFWGGSLKDVEDEGFCFRLPMCNDDLEMYDFFVHIPNPDNSSGIGDAPEVFTHIVSIIKNKLVKKIEFSQADDE
jgi:hypothetical protein